MVGCEHTEICLAVKYGSSQEKHTLGQKQTEKVRDTDARMAKIAKEAQRQAEPGIRLWRRGSQE